MTTIVEEQYALLKKLTNSFANFKKKGHALMTIGNAEARLEQLKENYTLFKENHDEIERADEVTSDDDYYVKRVYEEGEDCYYANLGLFKDHIASLTNPLRQAHVQNEEANPPNFCNFSSLPVINIPKFSGEMEDWENFRDMFRALIHNKPELPVVIKFQQLRTHLSGKALELIKSITLCADNYEIAWKTLKDHYDNKRRLVASYLNRIIDAEPMKHNSGAELDRLRSDTLGAYDSLIALTRNVGDSDLFIQLVSRKFDVYTTRDWQKSLGSSYQPPTLKQLRDFITFQTITLESIAGKNPKGIKAKDSSSPKSAKSRVGTSVHQTTSTKRSSKPRCCPCCEENHSLFNCDSFRAKDVKSRQDLVRSAKRCFNCLGEHLLKDCRSNFKCSHCKSRHHSLLHSERLDRKVDSPGSTETPNRSSDQLISQTNEASTSSVHNTNSSYSSKGQVLLATARVYVVGSDGQKHLVRALIDACSQSSLISRSLSDVLRLKTSKVNIALKGVNDELVGQVSNSVQLVLSPNFKSNYKLTFDALIVPKVSSYCPPRSCKLTDFPHLKGLKLADPFFYKNDRIDLLLSAAVHARIIESEVVKGLPEQPIASSSSLGWLLSGPAPSLKPQAQVSELVTLHCSEEPLLSDQLKRFWEIEEVSVPSEKLSKDELICEKHFEQTFTRDEEGRFSVSLPFKTDPKVLQEAKSESFNTALATFKRLENKFKLQPKLKEAYTLFMKEYVDLNHMILVPSTEGPSALSRVPRPSSQQTLCYLPHHGVIREASATTKLRVVFNGSSTTKSGMSLNKCLHTGSNLLPNLFDVILRWRKYRLVFTADIEKMFRQIRVTEPDQAYQAILWRESPDDELKTFHLSTVTYGLACSPYLACKVIKKLAELYVDRLPLGSKILQQEIYMDDVISGAHSFKEAEEKITQLNEITQKGCLPLRKWSSNHPQLLNSISSDSTNCDALKLSDLSKDIPVLGLHWCPSTDSFQFHLSAVTPPKNWTKRTLLSQLAKFFDPLGWISPTIVKAKIIMQSLWLLNIGWDDPLPSYITENWLSWLKEVGSLNEIRIPRWNHFSPDVDVFEIHGFSDASKFAYAAVIYIRTIVNGEVFVSLQTAKTKVAPIKTLSIPRLELCAAQLLCRLVTHYLETAEISPSAIKLYSDSKVVLCWLSATPNKWPVFVANRCSEIQTTLPKALWHYVKSKQNPADIASRGINPSQLKEQDLWFQGPQFLKDLEPNYPVFNPNPEEVDLHLQTIQEDLGVSNLDLPNPEAEFFLPYSEATFNRTVRIIAYLLRFIIKCKTRVTSRLGLKFKSQLPFVNSELVASQHSVQIDCSEVANATKILVFKHQLFYFFKEISLLSRSKRKEINLPRSSKLLELNPQMDKGLLRVGGRLSRALLDDNQKHPLILHPEGILTRCLVNQAHLRTLHGGVQLTLTLLRRNYWILRGRSVVKALIFRCFTCKRYKGTVCKQLMSDLPSARVEPTPPFFRTGVDYAGPFPIRLAKVRGRGTQKGYIVLFVCMSTKAVHLEVAEDYSTEAFLAAFHRFVSRRGHCAELFSDNGTNFVGASRELQEAIETLSKSKSVFTKLTELGTKWHFNPPAAPHFGGLWEAAVKSVKFHLKRVIGEQVLTFVEFSTLLCRIEACLNYRPLIPLSDDPADLNVLTPASFLTQNSSPLIPELDVSYEEVPPSSRWKFLTWSLQHLWKRWSAEYLATLQKRNKWQVKEESLSSGDLVLIKNELTPPGRWPLARVIKVFQGENHKVRVAQVRTANSIFVRPVAKLILLRKSLELLD